MEKTMTDENADLHEPPAPPELSKDVLALINNGLEFLDKAREELEANKPKFSVVSLWTAVEILLKVPLAHEHWSLVCSGNRIIRKKYQSGDFQSITFNEVCERLNNVLDKPLPPETLRAFDKVRQHRNRVVHFYHPSFSKADQQQILTEQADAWFALNRLIRDEWGVIFGANHGYRLALSETRIIQGNSYYAEVRFKQIKPELDELAAQNIPVSNCQDCHQNAVVTTIEKTGNEERPLVITRCKVCTSTYRHISLACPECNERQLLPEGEDEFVCRHCGCTSDRYELLDEEVFRSIDEQENSGFPAGCTNCLSPESVCPFGHGYLCTRCLLLYKKISGCGCCGHQSDSVPAFSHIGGCEFCDGAGPFHDD